MDLAQAIELANTFTLPGIVSDDAALTAERMRNEEAIGLLRDAWFEAPRGEEPFDFDVVRQLADRNRALCDDIGAARLRDVGGRSLARSLSDDDLVRGVAKLQRRTPAKVRRTAGPTLDDLAIAYVEARVSGVVCGIDIETTDRYPDRGYVINVGFEFMRLAPDAVPEEGHMAFFGIPERYADGVPLEDIHHVDYATLAGRTPFRQDKRVQKALLKVLTRYPYLAHNAAFEDSWFTLHLDGYAEARKANKVTIVDTRDVCRRIDVDARSIPRELAPAALENWARRRGTLAADEEERHLGLEDVDLMLRTVQAEFALRNMF